MPKVSEGECEKKPLDIEEHQATFDRNLGIINRALTGQREDIAFWQEESRRATSELYAEQDRADMERNRRMREVGRRRDAEQKVGVVRDIMEGILDGTMTVKRVRRE